MDGSDLLGDYVVGDGVGGKETVADVVQDSGCVKERVVYGDCEIGEVIDVELFLVYLVADLVDEVCVSVECVDEQGDWCVE